MQTSIVLPHHPALFAGHSPRMTAAPTASEPMPTGEFSLRLAAAGEWVKITGFAGRRGCRDRIAGIGLTVGARIQILKNDTCGKLLIGHAGRRLFMGGGMAHKIRVIHIKGEEE